VRIDTTEGDVDRAESGMRTMPAVDRQFGGGTGDGGDAHGGVGQRASLVSHTSRRSRVAPSVRLSNASAATPVPAIPAGAGHARRRSAGRSRVLEAVRAVVAEAPTGTDALVELAGRRTTRVTSLGERGRGEEEEREATIGAQELTMRAALGRDVLPVMMRPAQRRRVMPTAEHPSDGSVTGEPGLSATDVGSRGDDGASLRTGDSAANLLRGRAGDGGGGEEVEGIGGWDEVVAMVVADYGGGGDGDLA
jgi:hypothetical protein